jgi:hypothetical protein
MQRDDYSDKLCGKWTEWIGMRTWECGECTAEMGRVIEYADAGHFLRRQ